jgi:hypothetical protein
VPVALAQFASDTILIRRLAKEAHRDIVAWNTHNVGSHWAAHSATRPRLMGAMVPPRRDGRENPARVTTPGHRVVVSRRR